MATKASAAEHRRLSGDGLLVLHRSVTKYAGWTSLFAAMALLFGVSAMPVGSWSGAILALAFGALAVGTCVRLCDRRDRLVMNSRGFAYRLSGRVWRWRWRDCSSFMPRVLLGGDLLFGYCGFISFDHPEPGDFPKRRFHLAHGYHRCCVPDTFGVRAAVLSDFMNERRARARSKAA